MKEYKLGDKAIETLYWLMDNTIVKKYSPRILEVIKEIKQLIEESKERDELKTKVEELEETESHLSNLDKYIELKKNAKMYIDNKKYIELGKAIEYAMKKFKNPLIQYIDKYDGVCIWISINHRDWKWVNLIEWYRSEVNKDV